MKAVGRLFRARPASAVLVAAVLALAIGATSALIAVFDALVLRPIATTNQDRVVHLGGLATAAMIKPLAWWGQADALESLATYSTREVTIDRDGQSQVARLTLVSPAFFRVFAARPRAGFFFEDDDLLVATSDVVVLSHRFWRSHYGRESTRDAVVRLNGRPFVVIAVAEEGFDFPLATDLWIPAESSSAEAMKALSTSETGPPLIRPDGWVGRLRPGVSAAQAQSQLMVLLRRLHEVYTPRTGIHFGDAINVAPLRSIIANRVRPALRALLAGALFVLLIAAANAATFLLSRSAERTRELAIRRALGATPGVILRQTICEAMGLTVAAGMLGSMIALWLLATLEWLIPMDLVHVPRRTTVFFLTLGGSLVLAVTIGLFVSVGPYVHAISHDTLDALKEHSGSAMTGGRGRFLRRMFLVVEMALALVLTNAAMLALHTFRNLLDVKLGFNPQQALMASLVSLAPELETGRMRVQSEELLVAARTVPGVVAAGMANTSPLPGHSGGRVWARRGEAYESCAVSLVGGDYFAAAGIPIIAGRALSHEDAHTVVVNETAVRRMWADRSPIGDVLLLEGERDPRRVVGVVHDTRSVETATATPEPQLYLPFASPYGDRPWGRSTYLVTRCAADCSASISTLTDRLKRARPDVAIARVMTLEQLVDASLAPARARALILGWYSFLGLGVATLGVYALVSYLCQLRRHEIGIRAALGAAPRDLTVLVAGEGFLLATIGIIVGAFVCAAGARLMRGLLFGIGSLAPMVLATAAGLLLLAAAVASLVPAARAAKENAWQILRTS